MLEIINRLRLLRLRRLFKVLNEKPRGNVLDVGGRDFYKYAKGYANSSRNVFFYLLFPFMAVYAITRIAIGLLFSLGDLQEDPNDWLVVAKKG